MKIDGVMRVVEAFFVYIIVIFGFLIQLFFFPHRYIVGALIILIHGVTYLYIFKPFVEYEI